MVQRARTKGWQRLDRRRTNSIGWPRALVGSPNLLMGMSHIQKERPHHGRRYFRATQNGCHHLNLYGDWLLTEGESRDNLGEWLKKTQVRYQDQRRILKSIMHCFPSNFWRSKITNGKESDKCDLCKSVWMSQGRFTTESALPVQTLVHIQHTFKVLSEIHTMVRERE